MTGKDLLAAIKRPDQKLAVLSQMRAKPQAVAKAKGRRMNRWEAAYARRLEGLRQKGEIAAWAWEAITLRIGQDCRYTPDFVISFLDGTLRFVEVKGFLRDDALVKFKAAAAALGWMGDFVMVRKEGELFACVHEFLRTDYQPAKGG